METPISDFRKIVLPRSQDRIRSMNVCEWFNSTSMTREQPNCQKQKKNTPDEGYEAERLHEIVSFVISKR
jgi:hypothetical protein